MLTVKIHSLPKFLISVLFYNGKSQKNTNPEGSHQFVQGIKIVTPEHPFISTVFGLYGL